MSICSSAGVSVNMQQVLYNMCIWLFQSFQIILFSIIIWYQATGYASQHIWCLSQARINWEGCARQGIRHKNGGDCRDGAPISVDGVAVHPDSWCVCLCYLHIAPENPEDGQMYLLVPAHPGCPGQSPESCKMVVCVVCIIRYCHSTAQLVQT